MEGTGIRLEVCGELGDFSILSDFGTCPLFLTLPTPKGGSRPSFPDKITSLPARGCCSPIKEGAQTYSRGEVKILSATTLCPSASGRKRSTPSLPPETLQGSPPPPLGLLPLSCLPLTSLSPLAPISTPSDRLHPEKNSRGKEKRKKILHLDELSCKPWLWRNAAKQPLIPSQHCSIAGQRHL